MEEQLITAQTLSRNLIYLEDELEKVSAVKKRLEAEVRDCESALVDSLGEKAKVTYAVKDKAVTVIKAPGRVPSIVVTDLV